MLGACQAFAAGAACCAPTKSGKLMMLRQAVQEVKSAGETPAPRKPIIAVRSGLGESVGPQHAAPVRKRVRELAVVDASGRESQEIPSAALRINRRDAGGTKGNLARQKPQV